MDYLNYDSLSISHNVNGPGKRLVLWVQGCTLGCKGCFNSKQWPHVKNKLAEINSFSEFIISKMKELNCEGLTISGGEPLQQSKMIAILTETVKSEGFGVIIFTGYTNDEIKKNNSEDFKLIIKNIDILIAGRYNEKNLNEGQSWNNNSDKEIIYLTDLYSNYPIETTQIEFVLDTENIIHWTGFPNYKDIEVLR